jgi:hypothetical protein
MYTEDEPNIMSISPIQSAAKETQEMPPKSTVKDVPQTAVEESKPEQEESDFTLSEDSLDEEEEVEKPVSKPPNKSKQSIAEKQSEVA